MTDVEIRHKKGYMKTSKFEHFLKKYVIKFH